MGEDRTRDEEPGREMEGDTVMTMNTRDNSNQKGTNFIQNTTSCVLLQIFV